MPSRLLIARSTVGPLLLAFAALSAGTGCGAANGRGAAAPSKPAFVFPSRAELDALPTKAPSGKALGADDVRVDRWTFEAPVAHPGDAYDDASPWAKVVTDAIAKRRAAGASALAASPALRCAATELGRFYLQHQALPSESLRRFTVARCGSSAAGVRPIMWTIEAAASVPEDALVARGEAPIREALASHLGSEPARQHLVGLARVRDGARLVVVALTARDDARIEAGPRRVDAARQVRLEGTLTADAEHLRGWVNQGEDRVAACDADASVKLPRFALRCHVTPGDATAWIEVVAERKGRLLADAVAEVLAYDGDEQAIAYRTRALGAPAPVQTTAEFAPALVDRLNHVRTAAKLVPLRLAVRQSAANTRLAGTLLDASQSDDAQVADKAAVGLIAGWEIDGLIRRGDFLLASVPQTRDVTAWLEYALERPMGRRVLLDPNARQIAVGGAIPDGAIALGAAVTTYELFESNDHDAEADRLAERVAALRAERQLPAPVRVASPDELAPEARLVVEREKPPMAALDDAMQAVATKTGNSVAGWVVEATDLDAIAIPEPLLRPGALQFAIEVTHHRAPGAAWGQYVVLIVAVGVASGGSSI